MFSDIISTSLLLSRVFRKLLPVGQWVFDKSRIFVIIRILEHGCVSEIRTYYDFFFSGICGGFLFEGRASEMRATNPIILLCFCVKKKQIESGVESPGKLPSFPQKVAYFLGEIAPFS